MSREQLNKLSTKHLCELAGINYLLLKETGYTRDNLIELILTPND